MLDLSNLLLLLPPAIILSVLYFLINLFGKVIADPTPFADDRKWKREIAGVSFFLNHIITPIAGTFFLYRLIIALTSYNVFKFFWDLFLQFILLVIVSIIIFSFVFIGKKMEDFIYKNKAVADGKYYILQNSLFSLFTTLIIFLIVLLYNWGEYLYMMLAVIYLFLHLLGFAIFLSLKSENIGIVDIYFINSSGEQPIKECRLLKVNDDNVKIIKDNVGMIINKSQILRIEEKIDLQKLQDKKKKQLKSHQDYLKKILQIGNIK